MYKILANKHQCSIDLYICICSLVAALVGGPYNCIHPH